MVYQRDYDLPGWSMGRRFEAALNYEQSVELVNGLHDLSHDLWQRTIDAPAARERLRDLKARLEKLFATWKYLDPGAFEHCGKTVVRLIEGIERQLKNLP